MVIEKVLQDSEFFVIHSLDDVKEEKLDISHLGPMRMTLTVRLSLLVGVRMLAALFLGGAI